MYSYRLLQTVDKKRMCPILMDEAKSWQVNRLKDPSSLECLSGLAHDKLPILYVLTGSQPSRNLNYIMVSNFLTYLRLYS